MIRDGIIYGRKIIRFHLEDANHGLCKGEFDPNQVWFPEEQINILGKFVAECPKQSYFLCIPKISPKTVFGYSEDTMLRHYPNSLRALMAKMVTERSCD